MVSQVNLSLRKGKWKHLVFCFFFLFFFHCVSTLPFPELDLMRPWPGWRWESKCLVADFCFLASLIFPLHCWANWHLLASVDPSALRGPMKNPKMLWPVGLPVEDRSDFVLHLCKKKKTSPCQVLPQVARLVVDMRSYLHLLWDK